MNAWAALLVLAGVLTAEARIGESLKALESRYGFSYLFRTDEFESDCFVYGFDRVGQSALKQRGFEVYAVVDRSEICRELLYVKVSGGCLSPEEIQGILVSNAAGQAWRSRTLGPDEMVFVRTDGAVGFALGTERYVITCADRARLRRLLPGDT